MTRAGITAVLLLALISLAVSANSSIHVLNHEGRSMQLEISRDFGPTMRDDLRAWVDFVATALARVYGHWPRQRWAVSVTPVAVFSEDPIPWAQVRRGDVDRVEFYVIAGTDLAQLRAAWTGYHEMAHLLIPYRGWGDTWFSEGLASYYQNLLQARAGVINEQQMWQNIHDGFQRGGGDVEFAGQPLHRVSDRMRREGGFMRVYWSGVWYFLELDTRLRRQSGGSRNLDRALARLNECCADRAMSVREMVAELDRLNRVYLFQPLYEQVRAFTDQPPADTLFSSLGITVENGVVRLHNEGPGAQLRQQIAAPAAL